MDCDRVFRLADQKLEVISSRESNAPNLISRKPQRDRGNIQSSTSRAIKIITNSLFSAVTMFPFCHGRHCLKVLKDFGVKSAIHHQKRHFHYCSTETGLSISKDGGTKAYNENGHASGMRSSES
ncbi:hypothetical protein CEXT_222561 [Caerostris extrusa]|uniref:C2H2-type domain-containing protein n=1 Tax=Caerostris extrusa TaxID=172846 RepID=A0AAV4V909_CAEEX|nr:hypothetical protein CEXT_222561 [Caerostris extrusa]